MAHLNPGKNVRPAYRAVDSNPRTPGRTPVCRMRDKNIVVIGITNVNGMIPSHFHGEEKVIHTAGGSLVQSVTGWKTENRVRDPGSDAAIGEGGVDRSIALIDIDPTGLADRSKSYARIVNESRWGDAGGFGLVNESDHWIEGAIEQIKCVR